MALLGQGQQEVLGARQVAFRNGVSGFIVNGLIVARENSRRDVAWRIISTVLSEGYYRLLVEPAFLRQAFWLCRETLAGGKARGSSVKRAHYD